MAETPRPPSPPAELTPEKQALLALRRMRARLEELERAATEPIAIVGLGCRFPGHADSPAAYWRLLRDGVDAIREVPADRWDIDAYYDPDPDAPGKMYTRRGAFLDGVDRFDADHFRISPREAASMDPQQRLLLEVAWEALEHAGCAPDSLDGSSTGVFVGLSTNDYAQMLLRAADENGLDAYFGTGNALNAAAGRLSYVLGLQGPSIALDTACSSSLVAIHLACQSLRARECDLAIGAGVNLILTPDVTINFCRARMLAPDGRCKTFDASADGYVRGEGCGAVVLKRLSDAAAAGDRILALIRGSAVNQDGRSGGFTAPNERAQEALIRKALAAGGLTPADVSYIEAHGTGTSLGDPIEMHGLAAVFAKGRPADRPLVVGSVKTNMGHLEAAAGVAGVIKVVLALQHRTIPPHLHFTALNPHIDTGGLPLEVPTAARQWPGAERRVAGISSFGFSGTNAHVVVEEAPVHETEASTVDRPRHIVTFSARTRTALAALAGRYRDALAPDDRLADVGFTANGARAQLDERAAITAASVDELRAAFDAVASGADHRSVRRGTVRGGAPEVAFLFTGQGSQRAGMGRELYETQPAFRRALDRCDDILRGHLDRPLLSVMYPDGGDLSLIDQTAYSQPALFAFEYALAELWRSWGVEPAAVLGHSIGEFVAACVAGVFSLEDGLKLVAARGGLMQALPAGGAMAAVFAAEPRVRTAIAARGGRVSVAAINAPENTVVSGDAASVTLVLDDLAREGIKAQRLVVSHAFHSALLDPMLDAFERIASEVTYSPAKITLASNLAGTCVDAGFAFDAAYWRRHAREAVRFSDGVAALRAQGCRTFLEVGPSATLLSMAQQSVSGDDVSWIASLRKGRTDWEQILDAVAALFVGGVRVDWRGFDREYSRRKVALPTYPFERERFWVAGSPARRASVSAASQDRAPQSVDHCYEIAWRPVPAAPAAPIASGETWVLVGGDAIADGLADTLAGYDTRIVRAGADRCRDVFAAHDSIQHVVLLAALDPGPSTEDPVEAQRRMCGALLEVTQAIAACPGERPRFSIVTRGSQSAAAADPVACAQAPVWAMAGNVRNEHPDLRPVCIDLDPRSPLDPALLARELLSGDGEYRVAYRGGARLASRLAPLRAAPGRTPALRADASYIVTGGLGALGLQIAGWLAARGARAIALAGRRAPGAAARTAIGRLEASGVRVLTIEADVSRRADVARLFAITERELGPVRGIVHAAGVVDDGLVVDQTWDRMAAVFQPKIAGAWHLHEETRERPLDFFLLFSSMSALLGTPAQSAYAAANAYLDALAHERHGSGLPALSVNWGPWSDAGMAGHVADVHRRRWAQRGVTLIDPAIGFGVLDALLEHSAAQVSVLPVDWSRFVAPDERSPIGLLAEVAPAAKASREPIQPLAVRLAAAPAAQRRALLEAHVHDTLVAVLGREPGFVLDRDRAFRDLGMDSLMALELRNRLQASSGVPLPPTVTFEWPTVARMTDLLASELLKEDVDSAAPAAAAPAGIANLLSRVEGLSDRDIDNLLART